MYIPRTGMYYMRLKQDCPFERRKSREKHAAGLMQRRKQRITAVMSCTDLNPSSRVGSTTIHTVRAPRSRSFVGGPRAY